MRSVKLTNEDQVFDQVIIDFKTQLMIKIYQKGKQYAFRFFKSKDNLGTVSDPLNLSEYSWAYGPFKSPMEAIDHAFKLYENAELESLLVKK